MAAGEVNFPARKCLAGIFEYLESLSSNLRSDPTLTGLSTVVDLRLGFTQPDNAPVRFRKPRFGETPGPALPPVRAATSWSPATNKASGSGPP